MAFNTAEIRDRARSIAGRDISDQEAQEVMNATEGGQEDQVIRFFQGGGVSGGTTGGGTTNDFIKALVEPIIKELGDFEQRVKDFGLEGPFAFDEALAREGSKEIVDPFYDELLDEFISGVQVERRQGAGRERQLLENLSVEKEFETGDFRRKVEDAIDTTRQGFETKGLFASGLRRRAEGRAEAAGRVGERALEAEFGQRKTGIKTDQQNLLERLGIRERVGRRQIGTERREEIESGVEARRREQAQQTEVERLQTTALPFTDRLETQLNRLLTL
jgi:hypothetical protein